MTTEIHVTSTSNVYLNKQKNFCFCILRIVIFTSSKVQNKCKFNQNPFKNSIKKIHQKSAFFFKLKCITKVTLYEKGVLT